MLVIKGKRQVSSWQAKTEILTVVLENGKMSAQKHFTKKPFYLNFVNLH